MSKRKRNWDTSIIELFYLSREYYVNHHLNNINTKLVYSQGCDILYLLFNICAHDFFRDRLIYIYF